MSKTSKEPSKEADKQQNKKHRICSLPKDFTWNEMMRLLNEHGYVARKNGKTGGSRRRFIQEDTKKTIVLHEPHPEKIIKEYVLKQVIARLELC
jgi:predicted RNA binding protein YcfA (HicA-like mRNA interferase family)